MGGVGPGLAGVGPMHDFAWIPFSGKWILMFCMLLGRLDLYGVLMMLVPRKRWR